MRLSKALTKLKIFWAAEAVRFSAQELAWRECRRHCRRIRMELRAKRGVKGGN